MCVCLPGDDVAVAFLDGCRLGVVGGDELLLEGGDRLDALLLERLQTGVKRLLLGQQGLHRRQVTAVVVRADLRLLVS